jgi:hypothetical protein
MPPFFHSNRYHADAAGQHSAGLIRHDNWCITHNPRVFYAYEIVVNPQKLRLGSSFDLAGAWRQLDTGRIPLGVNRGAPAR